MCVDGLQNCRSRPATAPDRWKYCVRLPERAWVCVVLTFDSCASLFSSWVTSGTGQPIGGAMWKANELHVWQHITTPVTSQSQILCVTVHCYSCITVAWRNGIIVLIRPRTSWCFVSSEFAIRTDYCRSIIVCSETANYCRFSVVCSRNGSIGADPVRTPVSSGIGTNQRSRCRNNFAVLLGGTIFPPSWIGDV